MNSSLYTGVLGLKNHQTRMDVIGNNISNVNTYGFKQGRATFADLLSRTYFAAAAPRDGIGGVNPLQVGLGMTVSAVTNIMTRRQVEPTGRLTDVAIDGNGWFVLSQQDGTTNYTRDGSFSLDRDGSLVNANGLYVQGWTRVEADQDHNFTVDTQRPVTDIDFQYGEKMEAEATNAVGLKCNLDESSRSLIADGIDPKEGFATKNDLLVDLYDNDSVNPQHLGIREGDWLEIHVDSTYQQVPTLPATVNSVAITGAGAAFNTASGTVRQYTGLVDTSLLPMDNISIAGWTRLYGSPDSLVGTANSYTIDQNTGVIYSSATLNGQTLQFSTQSSALSTTPYEADKYLYFQVTNDTTIGNLETAIQNALDAIDVNGTINATVSYNTDEAKFYIYNNPVSGSGDYNDVHVEINAVSGSGIRTGYLLRESTYPTLTGTRLGITQSGLGGAMDREQVSNFDYQTNNLALDYGLVVGSPMVYGQVVRSRLEATLNDPTDLNYVNAPAGMTTAYLDLTDLTGYTAGGTLAMVPNTSELSVNGTTWSQVSVFSGAANEYRISTSGTGVPRIYFNSRDGLAPLATTAVSTEIVFSYKTDNAPVVLMTSGQSYTLDQTTGNISLMWSNSTADSLLGANAGSTQFTGTIRMTAEYTTDDRKLEPPAEIMNSRWADFAQEWAEVNAGGDGKARTNFNNMFTAINADRSATSPGTIYDQATATQPTSKTSDRFQSAETYRTSIDVYDSVGDKHTLQFIFTHVGSNYDLTQQVRNTNRWYWRAELPYDDTFAFDSMDNVDDSATAKLDGELQFDNNGLIISTLLGGNTGPIMFDPSPIGSNGNTTEAVENVSITANFDGHGTAIDGVTQYASDFTTRAYEQNGWAMGTLDTFAIDQSGVIEGTYSNNVVKPIAQIALAMFANQEGLTKVGDNLFAASANSGLANVVPAYVAGAGQIAGASLEASNVDLVQEFTNMIITERGYQANSRMITTSDEMLTEVINLKR